MNRENTIVVISCAGSKHPSAGHMMENGKKIKFVAEPEEAQKIAYDRESVIYKHPDDPADSGRSCREKLVEYNEKYKGHASNNPLGLLPAWKLYKNSTYEELISAFGNENVFILSAGWGLISADFLTPSYDITFSSQVREKYKKRAESRYYNDFSMLPEDAGKKVVFLGGKSYMSLFCRLTKDVRSEKIVFYNSKEKPIAPGCETLRFHTKAKTNWYYSCAKELVRGNLIID